MRVVNKLVNMTEPFGLAYLKEQMTPSSHQTYEDWYFIGLSRIEKVLDIVDIRNYSRLRIENHSFEIFGTLIYSKNALGVMASKRAEDIVKGAGRDYSKYFLLSKNDIAFTFASELATLPAIEVYFNRQDSRMHVRSYHNLAANLTIETSSLPNLTANIKGYKDCASAIKKVYANGSY